MIFQIIRLITFLEIIAVVNLYNFTPSSNDYLLGLAKLFPVFSTINLFDGPPSASNAPTKPSTAQEPTHDTLKYFSSYAAATYCIYELKHLTCDHCRKFKDDIYEHTVLRNDFHNTLALITVSKRRREIVVAYRGSMNVWNIVLDVMFINGGEGNIKLHKGFYIATMSLYNDVVTSLGYLRKSYSDYKIVIVGHSLGGSMARITQYFLHSLNQFPKAKYEIYTYGEPRCGNNAFADFMNSLPDTTARVVDRSDIIPHIIPTSILGLQIAGEYYIHVQTEFFIDGDNQRLCNRSTYEDPTCSSSLGPLYAVIDHLTYFDTNYYICFINNPFELAALPFYILEPSEILPPLPVKIKNFLTAWGNLEVTLTSPILGR